jgi:uncharacterized membrane protein
MKRYLITGLVIMLPVTLTLALVVFFVNLLTNPFVGAVKSILAYYNLIDTGFLFFSAEQVQRFVSQLFIITFLFLIISALGWVARWVLFNYMLSTWDAIVNKIPFIGTVYKACQDVIKTLFSSKSNAFKQVVMVPFPSKGLYSLGLVAKDDLNHPKIDGNSVTAVFLPTTPNPTSGFLMMYDDKDILYVDMKVEDALSYIVTCGMVASPLNGDGMIDLAERFGIKWPSSAPTTEEGAG